MITRFKNPLDEFNSIFGYRWLIGRDMIPALRRFGQMSNGVMLDVGCGDKPYVKYFSSVKNYIGIDLPRLSSKADIYANALYLPFANNSIDSVLSVWILDDLPEPIKFFYEAHRVLKPHGLWMMSEIQNYPIHNPPWDYYRFTRFGLSYLAEKSGFIVKEIKPIGGYWAAIGILLVTSFLHAYLARFLKFSIRLLYSIINSFFYALDRLLYIERATFGNCVLLEKI